MLTDTPSSGVTGSSPNCSSPNCTTDVVVADGPKKRVNKRRVINNIPDELLNDPEINAAIEVQLSLSFPMQFFSTASALVRLQSILCHSVLLYTNPLLFSICKITPTGSAY